MYLTLLSSPYPRLMPPYMHDTPPSGVYLISLTPGSWNSYTRNHFSQYILSTPFNYTPSIHSFYLIACVNSIPCFNAVKSDPNVKVLTECFFLLYHSTSVILEYINMPDCELCVTLSPAWYESTNTCIEMGFP